MMQQTACLLYRRVTAGHLALALGTEHLYYCDAAGSKKCLTKNVQQERLVGFQPKITSKKLIRNKQNKMHSRNAASKNYVKNSQHSLEEIRVYLDNNL